MLEIERLSLIFGIALLLALALTPVARWTAFALGAVDVPNGRKIHTAPIPRLGGLAVLAAILGSLALLAVPWAALADVDPSTIRPWLVVGAATVVVAALGACDDIRPVPAKLKFVIESLAALAVMLLAAPPTALNLPFGALVELGPVMVVVGALWIVGVTNAFNMIDGLDGLATGVGAIAATAVAGACALLGAGSWAVVLVATAGAFIGFLPYNVRPARIFLGDIGSLGLGFLLGAGSLLGLQQEGAWLVFPAVLALGLPVADCCFAIVRRALRSVDTVRVNGNRERYAFGRRSGGGLFTPDLRHLHHRLLDLRFTIGTSLLVLYLVSVALGVVAVATIHTPWIGPVVGFLGLAAGVYLAPRWLYHELRLVDRGTLLPVLEHPILKWRRVHVLLDAVAAGASYVSARVLVEGAGGIDVLGMVLEGGLVTGSVIAGLWSTGVYKGAYRHPGLTDGLRVVRGVVLGTILACGARYFLVGPELSVATWALCFYLMATLVVGARLSFRVLDQLHQRARSSGKRALIYGAGRAGELALREMLCNPELGLQPVGFVDDEPGLWGRSYYGYPVHPGGAYVTEILRVQRVERVVLATKKIPLELERLISDLCARHGVPVLHFELAWPMNGKSTIQEAPSLASLRIVKPQPTDVQLGAGRLRSSVDA